MNHGLYITNIISCKQPYLSLCSENAGTHTYISDALSSKGVANETAGILR